MPIKKYRTKRQRQKAFVKTINDYNKRATTSMAFRFHNKNDKDIIDKLNQQENKCGYVKNLIREDIKKSER